MGKTLGTKIIRYAAIFRKVRHLLPKNCLQSLYNAFIQCKIDYGIEIYGDASKKQMKHTQIHQNRILKILQHKIILPQLMPYIENLVH